MNVEAEEGAKNSCMRVTARPIEQALAHILAAYDHRHDKEDNRR